MAREPIHIVRPSEAASVQSGGPSSVPIMRASNDNTIQRWSGHEHKAFGDGAAAMAKKHKDAFKITPRIAHGKGRTMSLGEATEVAGDYTASPRALAEMEEDPADVSQIDNLEIIDRLAYYYLAATNINHFFPLADKEWRTQHGSALGQASQAGKAYQKGGKAECNRLSQRALQTEAFGLHFLQDSYASGHQ